MLAFLPIFFLFQALEVQLYFISPGVPCTDKTGTEARCYYFEEYKQLLLVDHNLHAALEKEKHLNKIVEDQALMLMQKDDQIKTYEDDKKILTERADRLKKNWEECLEDREQFPWLEFAGGVGVGTLSGIALTAALFWYFGKEN